MYSAWMLAQRRARFRWILTRIDHPRGRPLRILDVGGTVRYWATMPWQELQPVRITLLNLMLQPVIAPFSSVVGDARALPFPNRSFDVVISNSSLGHVGPYGDQARMAREVERVGARYFVQTPNERFPIDWRTLVPAYHWLPETWQAWGFAHLRIGIYPMAPDRQTADQWARRVRNVTGTELRQLFPSARLKRERVGPWTKSFTAHS
jgi:hypothetical protein